MEEYSLIVLVFAAVILLSTLVLIRRRNAQHQEALLALEAKKEEFNQIELIRVQNPSEQDIQAYELIEAERRKVWQSFSTGTSLAPKRLSHLSLDLIRKIASIYYPDMENPEYQTSVADLLDLNDRVITRVREYLDEFPLNTISDVNIHDILKYKEYYDKLADLHLVKIAREHKYLYTIGRYAWMGYNVLNPWYWGRKMAYTAGKEGTFRYLLSVIITVVGEEAVLVYSKRNLRAKAAAIEKNIAFEMINMAVIDGAVSQEEYEVVLGFILNNPRIEDHIKITLLKALLRKRSVKPDLPKELYDDKAKKRLLEEVERVAKADRLGLLKKREALKALEQSLKLESIYRAKLELMPHDEVHTLDLMQQNRKREEAILRLMVQAGVVEGEGLPETLRDYIIQRAESYPLPFDEAEQEQVFHEQTHPAPLDTLTDRIPTKAEKERALSDVLDALLWELPFTRTKEAWYTSVVSALDLKKENEPVLTKRLEKLLPSEKLVQKPPSHVLKTLYRLLQPEEQITALQETSSTYPFVTPEDSPQKKDASLWLCVTTNRVLVFAAAILNDSLYQHHLEFGDDLVVQIEKGKIHDTYLLKEHEQEIRIASPLFHSSQLKHALKQYLPRYSLEKGE